MDSERTPSEAVRVAVQELTATQKIELAGAFANKDARTKAFELIDRVERLAAANCAAVTSAASRVVSDAITGEAPAGYALVPLDAFAALAALSLHVGDAALDVEAMLKACVPGGDHCDPQQVADALRVYLGATLSGSGSALQPPAGASAAIPGADCARLMRFYAVDTLPALIDAQARHIEKLQAKLPPTPSLAARRVREG